MSDEWKTILNCSPLLSRFVFSFFTLNSSFFICSLLMLKHTFQHLHGVGEKTERRIWAAGVTNWE